MGKPDVTTLNSIIAGLFKAGDMQGAMRVYEEELLGRWGLKPDVTTLNSIIAGLFKAGDMQGAMRVYKEELLGRWGLKPDQYTFGNLLKIFSASVFDFDSLRKDVFWCLNEMQRFGVSRNSHHFFELLRICEKFKYDEAARELAYEFYGELLKAKIQPIQK